MTESTTIELRINGEVHSLEVETRRTLLEVLRQDLQLTGTKRGCNQGVCGACSILVDGNSIRSCLSLAVAMQGRDIVTIEGLGDGARLDPVQQAFLDAGAIQCGFCMPGMIISAKALLDKNPRPSKAEIRHALGNNICRCSGYVKVIDAVHRAATT
ncbi:MAG TPA: (2Fe-2S)-binding protein [Steroidobacteraceae bacterium]|nr:(2Fe-2S)-binding protein [Steroidobacteraceae bacterium]